MTEHWLEVLQWIQLICTLVFLAFSIGVLVCVLRQHNLEFNGLWKTRAGLVVVGMLWALCLMLGRPQLWQPGSGILIHHLHNENDGDADNRFQALCRAHVFLTFGLWQPLFFLIILMMLRSKAKSKLLLYIENPNKHVLRWSLMYCLPVFIVHIVILALSGVHEADPIVWATYTFSHHRCVIPIMSTGSFALFYAFFIVCYVYASGKLFTRLINRNLRYRVRWTQFFFGLFFPFEIFIRIVLLFIERYEKPYESLYHTYYFIDLIVMTIGIIEFVLLPVLDAMSFPLPKGVTAAAVDDYLKSEEERNKKRRPLTTKTIPALERVTADIQHEPLIIKNKPSSPPNDTAPPLATLTLNVGADASGSLTSLDKSNHKPPEAIPPQYSSSNTHNTRNSGGSSNNNNNKTTEKHNTDTIMSVPLTATDIEDIFADIDDLSPNDPNGYARDNSLSLTVDGISLDDLGS